MKLYTIFGKPVSHSKSPLIHNSVFKQYSNNRRYIRTLLESGEELKEVYRQLNISGASVTVPYKEVAFRVCDEVRGVAQEIGAVNCIVTEGDKLIGYNTDAYGFLDSIRDFKDINRVLLIGAGGTSKALAVAFLENGVDVTVLNRSEKRLEEFKNLDVKRFCWSNFIVEDYDLVVNVTSAGLSDQNYPIEPDTLKKIFKNSRYAVDVIYHETPFLKLAKEMNLQTKDGSLMLIYQGVLANQLFTEGKIDKDSIEKSMLKAFNFS